MIELRGVSKTVQSGGRPLTILGDTNRNNNPWGKNQYDALLGKIEHRFSKGFSVINAFTWSKLFEDTSWTGPEIAGRRVEHKLGGEDRPLRLSVAPIWNVPVGRKQKFGAGLRRVLFHLRPGPLPTRTKLWS